MTGLDEVSKGLRETVTPFFYRFCPIVPEVCPPSDSIDISKCLSGRAGSGFAVSAGIVKTAAMG